MDYRHLLQSPTHRPSRYLWVFLFLLWSEVTFAQVFNVTPSLTVGERYDDNIFQDKRNTEDDLVTEVTPGIRLSYQPSEEIGFDFMYNPTLTFFKDHTDENAVTQRLRLSLASPLSNIFALQMRDNLTITKEPVERQVEIEDEIQGITRVESQRRRERTIRNSAAATLQIQLASRVALGLSFDSLFDDVQDVNEDDEFRYGGGADVGYLTSIARGHRVSVGYTRTFFTFRPNSSDSPDAEDFQVDTLAAQYLHNFTSTLSGNVSFGYAVTESDDPALDGKAGFIGGARLTKNLPTGSASFSYDRGFTSGGGEGDLVTADRFVVRLSTDISPKVTVGLGGNISLVNFEQDNNNDRIFYVVRPTLVYRILRFWTLSANYSFIFADFDDSARADRTDHLAEVESEFNLGRNISLALTYRYNTRTFDNASDSSEDDEFTRNQILLTISYSPTLHFQ